MVFHSIPLEDSGSQDCTRDSALVTINFPSLHPLSFHEMIVILSNTVDHALLCVYNSNISMLFDRGPPPRLIIPLSVVKI